MLFPYNSHTHFTWLFAKKQKRKWQGIKQLTLSFGKVFRNRQRSTGYNQNRTCELSSYTVQQVLETTPLAVALRLSGAVISNQQRVKVRTHQESTGNRQGILSPFLNNLVTGPVCTILCVPGLEPKVSFYWVGEKFHSSTWLCDLVFPHFLTELSPKYLQRMKMKGREWEGGVWEFLLGWVAGFLSEDGTRSPEYYWNIVKSQVKTGALFALSEFR